MTDSTAATRWLVRPRPNLEARIRLVCFPFAGGGASVFRRWPDGLPATVEVCAVQPPGREDRIQEPAYRTPDSLFSAVAEAVGPHLAPPFALFGHSMGALVAFELARRLRRERRNPPSVLIVSGRIAPQLPLRRPPFHDLHEAEFRDELRRLEGTPRAVLDHDELMRLFTPMLRADFAVSDTYAYRDEPPLDVPIVALGGEDDPWVDRDGLEAWRTQTVAPFEAHTFPGKHFFLQSAEPQLLRLLGRILAQREGER